MTPTTPETEYAFWTAPETSFTVTYSLPVFHEIDFQVSEGFRRIPHGGIEVGGVLFGRLQPNSAQIDAFRLIECEHANGPSFVLSDRDLAALTQQLDQAKTDPDLKGLQPVGWFVAHTRSPLRMNDRETSHFAQFFPGPGKIMLLIKPARFQPTRFGFLVRGADGRAPADATQQAVILPLPGRASRGADGPIPSIPAPAESAAPASPVVKTEPRRETPASAPPPARVQQAPTPAPESSPQVPAAHYEPPPVPVRRAEPERPASGLPYPAAHPLPSAEEIKRRRSEVLMGAELLESFAAQHEVREELRQRGRRSTLRLVLVLLFAAALGCAVGYWAYLELPSATIPLQVRAQPTALFVSWSPEQTRDAAYAAVRIDDGQQVPLSPQQKKAGQAEIKPVGANVKVELIAQHWMRDSRGIVRYVKPVVVPQLAPAPADSVSTPAERVETSPK